MVTKISAFDYIKIACVAVLVSVSASCGKMDKLVGESNTLSNGKSGNVALNIEIPGISNAIHTQSLALVTQMTVTCTRPNYPTQNATFYPSNNVIKGTLVLSSGPWTISVKLKSASGLVLYTGNTSVTVIPDETVNALISLTAQKAKLRVNVTNISGLVHSIRITADADGLNSISQVLNQPGTQSSFGLSLYATTWKVLVEAFDSNNVQLQSASQNVTISAGQNQALQVTMRDNEGNLGINLDVQTIPVTGVTLSNASLSITVGQNRQLTATVAPGNASQSVLWTVSDSTVATVDDSGKVTAIATGSATITAISAEDGSKSAACSVTVTQ